MRPARRREVDDRHSHRAGVGRDLRERPKGPTR
jgi:hypothetical protein